jgi:hypothetical protein
MSGFEEWYEERLKEEGSDIYRQSRACIEAAYAAGMERAAAAAENWLYDHRDNPNAWVLIAAAIRAEIKEGK